MSQSANIVTETSVLPHDERLFSHNRVAESVGRLTEVGDDEVSFFQQHGYLCVRQAFSNAAAQAASAAIDDLIDGVREDFRGIQFEAGVGDKGDLSTAERRVAVRKLMSFVDFDDRLKNLSHDAQLLAVIERLIGAEPFLSQEMALLKPPRIGREKPWHQDCAFFNVPMGTPVLGVWIALDEATAANGAMHVIPGSHLKGPVEHFKVRDWQICDTEVDVAGDVVVPLKPGGILFWHGMTHHGSPTNRTDKRRRALQFHYRPQGVIETSTEKRMEVFGGEVRGATC